MSSGWVEAVEHKRWAADLAALEPADRTIYADDGGVRVEFDDDPLDSVQVTRAGVAVDPHSIADAEHCERLLRVDRVQELVACADRFGDRDQMLVQLA